MCTTRSSNRLCGIHLSNNSSKFVTKSLAKGRAGNAASQSTIYGQRYPEILHLWSNGISPRAAGHRGPGRLELPAFEVLLHKRW